MSSRFERRPSQGSGSGSGARGRRPFRDGPPPMRRDRDATWRGRSEAGNSDRRFRDSRFDERRSSDQRSSSRRPTDRRSPERRSTNRPPLIDVSQTAGLQLWIRVLLTAGPQLIGVSLKSVHLKAVLRKAVFRNVALESPVREIEARPLIAGSLIKPMEIDDHILKSDVPTTLPKTSAHHHHDRKINRVVSPVRMPLTPWPMICSGVDMPHKLPWKPADRFIESGAPLNYVVPQNSFSF